MKKAIYYIIVAILVIGILGLLVFIMYDKGLFVNNKTKQEEIDKIDNLINNDNTEIKNAEDYIKIEKIAVGTNNSTIQKISIVGLDESLTNSFTKKQEEVINKTKNSTKVANETWYQINQDILSVYEKIEFDLEISDGCKEVITTNIDLKNNKLLSNEEVLSLAGKTYTEIAEEEYQRRLDNSNDRDFVIIDKETAQIVTKEEYTNNKTKIISDITTGLENIIDAYIYDNTVKYDYVQLEIESLYSNPGKGGCFPIETEIVGPITNR